MLVEGWEVATEMQLKEDDGDIRIKAPVGLRPGTELTLCIRLPVPHELLARPINQPTQGVGSWAWSGTGNVLLMRSLSRLGKKFRLPPYIY